MGFRNALVAATILALPLAANAQPVNGLYIGGGVGPDFQLKEQVKNLQLNSGTLGSLSTSGNMDFSTGFAGLMNLGWGFGNGLRAEIEGNYRNTHGSGFTGFTRFGALSGGGDEEKYGPMVNALYDFVGLTPYVQPYIGAGVGVQFVNDNNFHGYNNTAFAVGATTVPPGGFTATASGTKTVFAYQAIVGAAVPIAGIPGLAVTAEYRFLGTAGDRSEGAHYSVTTAGGRTGTGTGSAQFGPTYDNAVLFGIRYNFGVAPPPAPAAAPIPASPISRSYLVFFDWDKADLTDRARQIVAEAAANSTKVQYTQLEVNGYTDTSGTAKYNQGLSVRRAQAVAAELVKDGVPKSAITIQGFGETHLLVATGQGVREPQNRRVEIIIK
ncbi:MAG: OmpA family protein [Rhodopila sp.]|nr:OmpA family protein [Rhodopila sp.]